jgi:hypothetical protein
MLVSMDIRLASQAHRKEKEAVAAHRLSQIQVCEIPVDTNFSASKCLLPHISWQLFYLSRSQHAARHTRVQRDEEK